MTNNSYKGDDEVTNHTSEKSEKNNKETNESTPKVDTTKTDQTFTSETNPSKSNDALTEDAKFSPKSVDSDELNKLKEENERLEDQILRVSAELANIQKRNAKERSDNAKYRSQSLATELLPAIDNLERALEIKPAVDHLDNLVKGLEMVQNSIVKAFKDEGIEVIDPLGEPFDPKYHQAVQTMPASEGQKSDVVCQVLQKGYILKDRVIRPAMVIVTQ